MGRSYHSGDEAAPEDPKKDEIKKIKSPEHAVELLRKAKGHLYTKGHEASEKKQKEKEEE